MFFDARPAFRKDDGSVGLSYDNRVTATYANLQNFLNRRKRDEFAENTMYMVLAYEHEDSAAPVAMYPVGYANGLYTGDEEFRLACFDMARKFTLGE